MADVGRPTVMTQETIAKLEEAFLMSFSDREACLFAGINPSTLYDYCKENPDFSERKELLKEQVKLNAKRNIAGEIVKGDRSLSTWWLERRDADFKPKQENDNKGHVTVEITKYSESPASPQIPAEAVPATPSQSA